jgi:hypothetical protein
MKMQSLEIKVGPIGQEDAIQNTIDGIMFDMDYFHEGKVTLIQFKNQLKMGAGIVKTTFVEGIEHQRAGGKYTLRTVFVSQKLG